MRTFLLVVAGFLVLAAPAAGGGWATVGTIPPDDGLGPGEPFRAELTVLQHGQTPLDGVVPAVIVSNGDVTRRFEAKPAGKPGLYVADVEFPSAGTWSYAVYDGFTEYGGARTHTFKPVQIGPGGGGGGVVPGWTWVLAAAAGALALLAVVARRLRPATAPVAN